MSLVLTSDFRMYAQGEPSLTCAHTHAYITYVRRKKSKNERERRRGKERREAKKKEKESQPLNCTPPPPRRDEGLADGRLGAVRFFDSTRKDSRSAD